MIKIKVLSIREPYASLILNKIKYIETRSWNTNYRGKIYIHSCKKRYPIKEQIKNFINEKQLKYGYIIAEAEIIDCIYIDKKFAQKIKSENINNFLCGDYSEGRYAWVLANVKKLDNPIKINGQLGLWNYNE